MIFVDRDPRADDIFDRFLDSTIGGWPNLFCIRIVTQADKDDEDIDFVHSIQIETSFTSRDQTASLCHSISSHPHVDVKYKALYNVTYQLHYLYLL